MENKKIEALTPAQEAKFPEYVEKYIKLGLTTARVTKEETEIDMENLQKYILENKTIVPVVLFDSPKQCWEYIRKAVNAKKGELTDFIYPYLDGQFWAGWVSFYEFMRVEVGIVYANMDAYNAVKSCIKYGMIFPLDEVIVVCQPPTIIKTNSNGLHCEDGVALSYNGDNEIYALNGVLMTKDYVLTPAEQITPEQIFRETNVEVRRELLRKVGIERIIDQVPHKILDTQGNYELYSLDLCDEVKDARYLKMTNPSIGCFHMEGVEPDISTVSDALKWRNQNMFEHAEVLT